MDARRAPAAVSAVEMRLATPADVPAISGLYRGLSPDSQRLRFSSAPSEEALGQAASLEDRFDAVLAVVDGNVIGEARVDTHPGSAHELALTVADAAQGRGIGTALLEAIREHANDIGIVTMRAQVRTDNVAMLILLRRIGGAIVMVSGGDVLMDVACDRQMPAWPADGTATRVLVEAPGLGERSITTALRSAGYEVRQCIGPMSGRRERCPLLETGRCRLAQDADAIICLLPEGDEESRAIVSSHALHRADSLAAGFALSRR